MKPIQGFGVSKVVASDNPDFKPGDLVSGITGWEEYSLIQKPEQFRTVQHDDIPLSFNLGLLGITFLLPKNRTSFSLIVIASISGKLNSSSLISLCLSNYHNHFRT